MLIFVLEINNGQIHCVWNYRYICGALLGIATNIVQKHRAKQLLSII